MKFGKNKEPMQDKMHLQITPMASIFTVIIVLLLKSYTGGVSTFETRSELTLPEVPTANDALDGLKVEISPTAVLVDGKTVVTLSDFGFEAGEVDAAGGLKHLTEAITLRSDARKDEKVLIVADQRAPYSTVKRVLTSTAGAGLSQLKMVVVRNE